MKTSVESRIRLPRWAVFSAGLAGLAALSGCGPQTPVVVAPPPPVVVIPPKPTPPNGAQAEMTIPPVAADGERHTVNYGISTPQAVWNLRSAYNVAALNCTDPKYAPILAGYKRFLTVYDKSLDKANAEIDRSFRTGHTRREAIKAREAYLTQVYNYFSLPPAGTGFCEAALGVTTDLESVTPAQFDTWSYVGLAKMEKPFKDFFNAFEKYRADLAAWETQYGGGLVTVRPSFDQQTARAEQSYQP